jgi:ribosomal protein S18 acetylase RimI-like enzyme
MVIMTDFSYSDIHIRYGTRDDLQDIMDISKNALKDDYILSYINEWFIEKGIMIAEINDKPVGFQKVEPLWDNSLWLSAARVLKEWRRSGIGSALLSKAIERATIDGLKVVRMAVFDYNTPSINLVRKFKFTIEARYVEVSFKNNGYSETGDDMDIYNDRPDRRPSIHAGIDNVTSNNLLTLENVNESLYVKMGNNLINYNWCFFVPDIRFIEQVNKKKALHGIKSRFLSFQMGKDAGIFPLAGNIELIMEEINDNTMVYDAEDIFLIIPERYIDIRKNLPIFMKKLKSERLSVYSHVLNK